MAEILLSIVLFTGIVVALAAVILVARSRLVESGTVAITVNDGRVVEAETGFKLLAALAEAGIYLPAACGGRGTCGQCRVVVEEGGGALLPVETAHISRSQARHGDRLACQVTIKSDMRIAVPEEIVGAREITCQVRSARNVAPLIREIVLAIPPGEDFDYRAGNYVQVHCPTYRARFTDFAIDAPYDEQWRHLGIDRLTAETRQPTTRAYSIASYPGEGDFMTLDIRLALAPPGAPASAPPGVVSSYLFSLKEGDSVTVSGPFGNFFVKDSEAEMIFVGGGVGLAPLRSLIFDQLKRVGTHRPMTFWYGARRWHDIFYGDQFDRLAAEHDNFSWHVALSEPATEDEWAGPTGFIHEVLFRSYLSKHPAPEDCEYYLCGPPLMTRAVTLMLADLGVPPQNIAFDDFGG